MFNNNSQESNWLSLADMMTALMVIFMFVAINYIMQVIEHTFVEKEIYNKLQSNFTKEINTEEIKLGPDGTVRFSIDQGEKLFENGEAEPTPTFKSMLEDFLPEYWSILNSDSSYFDYIKEIRIEGHSDNTPFKGIDSKERNYLKNLYLSQRRAANVLEFLRNQPLYKNAPEEEKERMDFLFTSIGFSYSRALNDQGEYVYLDSNKNINKQMSRRVEFRIVTSNEELAEKLVEQNEN